MRLGDAALAEARTMVGLREQPAGSNCAAGVTDTWPSDVYGCCFWCAAAVMQAYHRAGRATGLGDIVPNIAPYDPPRPGSVYVPHWTGWADRDGLWVDPTQALPGDIIIFGDSDHIGLVAGPMSGDGWIPTVEGNTAVEDGTGDQADGIWMAERSRHRSWVRGVLRPPGADLDTAEPAAPAPEQQEDPEMRVVVATFDGIAAWWAAYPHTQRKQWLSTQQVADVALRLAGQTAPVEVPDGLLEPWPAIGVVHDGYRGPRA